MIGIDRQISALNFLRALSHTTHLPCFFLYKTTNFRADLELQTEELNQMKVHAQQRQEQAEAELRVAKEMHDKADAELEDAMPELDEAKGALKQINPALIAEIRRPNNPPPAMTIVIEPLCIILGRKPKHIDRENRDDYWPTARDLFADMRFVKLLHSYDATQIPDDILAKLQPYIDDPHFTPSQVERTSVALKSLCFWIRSAVRFNQVWRNVYPLKQREEETNKKHHETLEVLAEIHQRLEGYENILRQKHEMKENAANRQTKIEQEIADGRQRLQRATKLTQSLSEERTQWRFRLDQMEGQFHAVVGNCLLCAGFLAYCGPLGTRYRKQLLAEWKSQLEEHGIPYTPGFTVPDQLATPLTILEWTQAGLPSDPTSLENGALAMCQHRWPYLIDPQQQGAKWIRALEESRGLLQFRFGSGKILPSLGKAVRDGLPFLYESVGARDPALRDLALQKTLFSSHILTYISSHNNLFSSHILTYISSHRLCFLHTY
ncbi:putative Dynein heavy chain 1; axonemal [Paratrimastix pyriformis]|uniref:Dynein heavy chain 1 n=1 Tax=Paratrimastix pyriformis TaxID=342808 RepID=A0ABQ8UCS1_9EUKA|nr:putative Dynein heavy chain 1; axonemal [Paratrimastix pyriformis]